MVDEPKTGLERTRRALTLEELVDGADKIVGAGAVLVVDEKPSIPKPVERLVAVQIRIPASIADLIETAAFERKTSKSAYILRALAEHYGLSIPEEWTAQTKRRRS